MFRLRRVIKTRPGAAGFCLHIDRLDVPRGALLALIGPSGCGKSTALDLLACALRPDPPAREGGPQGPATTQALFAFAPAPGAVTDVLAAWERGGTDALARLRLRHLGYVLQTGGLLPFLTAGENILLRRRALGLAASRLEDPPDAFQDVPARLGIARLLGQRPATLSVGERQRAAIAAALAHGPSVVLADEPTAALDPLHANAVLRLLAQLARELNVAVIMVTHDAAAAAAAGFTPVPVRVHAVGEATLARICWPENPDPDAPRPEESKEEARS